MHAAPPRRGRRPALLVGAGAVVAAVALVAGVLAAPSAPGLPAAPWLAPSPLVVANLRVLRCPTSYGIPTARHVAIPRFVRAQVTLALAHRVAVFTDGLGTVQVLAPSTWGCTALDSIAGSSRLVVYPPGSPVPSWGRVTAVPQGIEASQTGGCGGCSLEVACPLFVGAARAYAATYRVGCGRQASPQERRTRLSASTVLFVDPAGVLGAGQPSGGGYVAYGAMLWHLPHDRHATAWLDTCTLPAADHALCVLSVRAFLSRHPSALDGPLTAPFSVPGA